VARELTAMFLACSEGGDAADSDAMGGFCDALSRGVRAIREASVVERGGLGAARDVGSAGCGAPGHTWPVAVQCPRGGMSAADAVDGSSTGATSAIDVVLLGHS
jgi:hypothetical protein